MTDSGPRLEVLRGRDAIAGAIAGLARLRIEVFRAWPYLYDGNLDYEKRYLEGFAASEGAVLVAADVDGILVGASTGLPLIHEHAEFASPLAEAGLDPASVFYCAETVLRPAYRGQGLYRRFFVEREAHARNGGFSTIMFCGVVRPSDHPLRPGDDRPLDPVWRHFGYTPLAGAVAEFAWTDIGETSETKKPMQIWTKPL